MNDTTDDKSVKPTDSPASPMMETSVPEAKPDPTPAPTQAATETPEVKAPAQPVPLAVAPTPTKMKTNWGDIAQRLIPKGS